MGRGVEAADVNGGGSESRKEGTGRGEGEARGDGHAERRQGGQDGTGGASRGAGLAPTTSGCPDSRARGRDGHRAVALGVGRAAARARRGPARWVDGGA